jgi:hypothetical protein
MIILGVLTTDSGLTFGLLSQKSAKARTKLD